MAVLASRSAAGRWTTSARRDGKAAQTAQKLKGSIDDGGAATRRRPDIAEIYSPPRITAVAAKHGLQPG
eukprot:8885830-Heterocapsa_arctica.AAC.1